MRAVSQGFRASIQDALDHEDEALANGLQFGRGLDVERGRRFVRMYVNPLTLDLGETGGRAHETLYGARWRRGRSPTSRPCRSSSGRETAARTHSRKAREPKLLVARERHRVRRARHDERGAGKPFRDTTLRAGCRATASSTGLPSRFFLTR